MINTRMWAAPLLLAAAAIAACGQTGQLYLPDAPGEIVTRPAATPPSPENTEAPPTPAAETDEPRKEKGPAAPPPPK